jgi:hypothetical protein
MEQWQFLIQKQGERTWRALTSPGAEITEGRYRVLARTPLTNTDVEVRLTHNSDSEVSHSRRIKKRLRRTNSEGLIAVIPFMYLKPGVWELQCCGDLMSDMLGKSWQYSVTMQVLPLKKDEEESSLSSGSPSSGECKSELQEDAIIEQPVSPVWLKQKTAEEILQNLIELALPDSESLLEDETIVEDSVAAVWKPLLSLTLHEGTYIARWGETLTISGRVVPRETTNLPVNQLSNSQRLYYGKLKIELRLPQTLEVVSKVRRAIPETSLPFNIKCPFRIPPNCESKLILADVSIYGALTKSAEVTLLAVESFTITAEVTELLAITDTTTSIELQNPDSQSASLTVSDATLTPKPSTPLNLELFNLVKTPKKAQSFFLQPSPKKTFPPRINSHALRKSAIPRSPQLPKFSYSQTQTQPDAPDAAVDSETPKQLKPADKDNLISTAGWMASTGTAFPFLRRLKALPDNVEEVQDNTPLHSQAEIIVDTQYPQPPFLAPIQSQAQDESFIQVAAPSNSVLITTNEPYVSPLIQKWIQNQGYSVLEPINLEYEDYNAYIASNQEQKGDEEDITNAEYSEISSDSPPTPPASPSPPVPNLALEIVVDDTPSELEALGNTSNSSEESEQIVSNLSENKLIAAAIAEPLPVPQLYLPEGELVSGKSVWVRVNLPEQRPQVAVKLWMEDCQTRWLVESPRLLTNLLPLSSGGMEVMTQLNVPFGCLEIHLEAITVDTVTQQESDKVTIHRTVVPPDLPNVRLDELIETRKSLF